jgi:hypothetical protein
VTDHRHAAAIPNHPKTITLREDLAFSSPMTPGTRPS